MWLTITALKMKFAIKDFSYKCDLNPQKTADFFKYTEEFPNEKLHFFVAIEVKRFADLNSGKSHLVSFDCLSCSLHRLISEKFEFDSGC